MGQWLGLFPPLETTMAQKPFRDITDRDLFAGLIMAAVAAKHPDRPMGVRASRNVEAADHLIVALKVPVDAHQ
jgi:hypothetical protein